MPQEAYVYRMYPHSSPDFITVDGDVDVALRMS